MGLSKQHVHEKGYASCNLETFTEWQNGYYFFAGHNCEIYDLKLTLVTDVGEINNVVEFSEGYRPFDEANICTTVEDPEGDYDVCSFILTPHNRMLGIHFSEQATADIRVQTDWSNCVDQLYPE